MPRPGHSLKAYRAKRDFRRTPEPRGTVAKAKGSSYLIQKHDARRLHYDFRLELDGVLKSWAVTRGPSLNPGDKRLAVRTEDHPLQYGAFEGVIPKGYGAGTVMLWDQGTWRPKGDPHEGLRTGTLKFVLYGERLNGGFALIRMRKKGGKRENWLLVKERDEEADEKRDPTKRWTKSVASGRSLEAIAEHVKTLGRNGKVGDTKSRVSRRKSGRKKLQFVPPQLPTLRDAPPNGRDWLHEVKFDGYRIQARVHKHDVRLSTRNGNDWTDRYSSVAESLAKLGLDHTIIDGELVAVDRDGRSHFGTLQNTTSNSNVELRYYAFDLIHLDGKDIRRKPLTRRKEMLRPIVDHSRGPLRYSDHIAGSGERVIAKACAMGMEGIVSKRADAPYRSGRGTLWIKSKCVGNDEFVIIGYRKSNKQGRPFASLLMGEYADGELAYRGRVGTGFDDRLFRKLAPRMKSLERATSPLARVPAAARADTIWLEPELVAQVSYTERTATGLLRHPSFLGLREDKPAKEVTMTRSSEERTTTIGGVRVTHPDRVMYPKQSITKKAIAEYYLRNADRILPFLRDRPLSLVRCPVGRNDKCFFQKHHYSSVPDELDKVNIKENGGKKSSYLVIRNARGLVASAQIGALELHIWGARTDDVERPERLVFDLDPDTSVHFRDVRGAAFELRDVLKAVGLTSFALLTGGKGVHVIVPIVRRRGWPEVKSFAKTFAERISAAAPDRYLTKASKARRKGRIFIDWLRNQRGATAVAPYSLRAHPGAPVATPVSWDELGGIDRSDAYTIKNIEARLAALKKNPWPDYHKRRQYLSASMLSSIAP